MNKHKSSSVVMFFSWLGGHELVILLALVGLASGAWLFGFIASEVTKGDTRSFDTTILLALRRPGDLSPIGPPFLQESARDLTALGGATALALLTALTSTLLLLDGRRRMALFVCASVVGGLLMSTLLKAFFQRPRPDVVPYAAPISTTSFPSGHSMLSAVTYLTLGALLARSQPRKRLKAFFLLAAAFVSFLVGLSRVYLGVHWPTDVLAGWTAGASWAVLCWLLARRLQVHQAIETETQRGAAGE